MASPLETARIEEVLRHHAPDAIDDKFVEVRAAVAVILRPRRRTTDVLLIRRSDRPGDSWSGHMAFPGGRQEPDDHDLIETACRETREEIGIDLAHTSEYLGWLSDVPTVATAGMIVRPYFFRIDSDPEIRPNYEVAEVIWAPLEPMFNGDAATIYPYLYRGQRMDFPAFEVDGNVVWGLTYKMLMSFFDLLRTPQ